MRARLGTLWSGVLAADPGSLRFRLACRTTLAVALAAAILVPLLLLHDLPVLAPAGGVTFALMASSLPREPRPRTRLVTTLMMALAAGLATALAALTAAPVLLGQAIFLAVLFCAVGAQNRGPRAIAVGLAGVVHVYLALFLKADPAHVPAGLAGLALALPVVWLAGFILVPDRPGEAVQRILRALERQGAILVRGSGALAGDLDASRRLRLRRRFALLNEAILSAEDYLAAMEAPATAVVSGALMRFEIALLSLSAAAVAAGTLSRAEGTRLRLAAARLVAGRRSALRERGAPAATPVLTALDEVEAAAADMIGAARAVRAGLPGAHGAATTTRAAFAWRPAIRAASAACLAMAGGQIVSPERWFWAVLTAYVVFLGARSSGEMIHRGVLRVWGTVVGLVVGVVVAHALAGHPVLEVAGLLVGVFAFAYVFAISQTLAIFCVTVILGLIYSLVGVGAETILLLRLEETAIGALAAVAVDRLVFPRPAHDHLRETGGTLLETLATVVRLCAARLGGDAAAAPVPRMRQADRLLRDLRLALRPLRAARTPAWWARRPAELPALLVCVFWVRALAASSEGVATPAAALLPRIEEAALRLEALARAEGGVDPARAAPDRPVEIGASHVGRPGADRIETVLVNLDGVIALLERRFGSDGWAALIARRPL